MCCRRCCLYPRSLMTCLLGISVLSCSLSARPAHAQSALTGSYFKIPFEHPDTENGNDFGTVTGLVEPTLGPDDLPVVSAFGRTYSGPSGPITDVNSLGEILWWSTTSPFGVQFEKTQTDTLPFSFSDFFPDGQTGDTPFYRAVHWTGTFDLSSPGSITLNLGSDDDAFVFIDGQLKVDDGGIHGIVFAPTVISDLTAGMHNIDLFYADRHTISAGIDFSASVTLTPSGVPEPGSVALLFGLGLTGVGFLCRKRAR